MSKPRITEVGKSALHPSSIEGFYLKELPLDLVREMSKVAEANATEMLDDELVFRVFNACLCDSEGERIEDLNSAEDVGRISIVVVRKLFNDIAKIARGEDDEGNP